MSGGTRFLLTQSLLSAWLYQYQAWDKDGAHKDFLRALGRQHTRETQAIRDGIQFENLVQAACEGGLPVEEHPWRAGVLEAASILQGSQFQVPAYQEVLVDRVPFLLYGRLDALKAGSIYDIKFSRGYQRGKYLQSPQHPMYFALCPEARDFTYVVYTGQEILTEGYRREDAAPIEGTVREFMAYLEAAGLAETYIQLWKARN